MSVHGKRTADEDITDPVENMLKQTGCIELHYKVQARYNHLTSKNLIICCRTEHSSLQNSVCPHKSYFVFVFIKGSFGKFDMGSV